jgi:glycerate kinase
MILRKIVVAADSFKGSLTSQQVADSIEKGIHSVIPDCRVTKIAIADGGEGTVEAVVGARCGELVEVVVADPLMRPVGAKYGIVDGGKTAVIEMAAASGLPLLSPAERNPMLTTTFGTGELIKDALGRGCRKFLIGIGGSATNDAGTGMLSALGFRFSDSAGKEISPCGGELSRIDRIDSSGVLAAVADSEFVVACDVDNPLSGPNGAAYVFARQKGADDAMIARLDEGLVHFATVIRRYNGADIDQYPGAGAAGGLGGAFLSLLGGRLISGIDMVLEAVGFAEQLGDADLVITGEGKLDRQTAMGKAPGGVLKAAERAEVPVIAIGGAVTDSAVLAEQGFAAVFSIQSEAVDLAQAMCSEYAMANVERTAEQIARLLTLS